MRLLQWTSLAFAVPTAAMAALRSCVCGVCATIPPLMLSSLAFHAAPECTNPVVCAVDWTLARVAVVQHAHCAAVHWTSTSRPAMTVVACCAAWCPLYFFGIRRWVRDKCRWHGAMHVVAAAGSVVMVSTAALHRSA